jgi:myotubularin-related protein 6/7/8
LDEFLNPLYRQDAQPDLLAPNLAPPNIHFWRGLYCRFESGVHPRESVADVLLATRDHSASMELHIGHLQKRITSLKVRLIRYLHGCKLVFHGVMELDSDSFCSSKAT